jgi:hypothetical protein
MASSAHNNGGAGSGARSGMELICNLNTQLLSLAAEHGQAELESYCRTALLSSGRRDAVERHDAIKNKTAGPKKPMSIERAVLDFLPSIMNPVSPNQQKNHAIRFGLEEQAKRNTWTSYITSKQGLFQNSSSTSSSSAAASSYSDYEDVVALDILRAPIVDMCIVQRGEVMPPGFYRIARTPTNRRACFNSLKANNMYLCIKKDLAGRQMPVTSLIVIFPDRNEFVPPGYHVLRRSKYVCNVNSNFKSERAVERVFLCYKKDTLGDPITDVQIFFPKHEDLPKDFNLVEYSPTGIEANLNKGSTGLYGGVNLMIAYKQSHASLLCLENDAAPMPLYQQPSGPPSNSNLKKGSTSNKSENDLPSLGTRPSRAQSACTDSSIFSGASSSSSSSSSSVADVVPMSPKPKAIRSASADSPFEPALGPSIPPAEDAEDAEDGETEDQDGSFATDPTVFQSSPRHRQDTLFSTQTEATETSGDAGEEAMEVHSDIEDFASEHSEEDLLDVHRSTTIVLDCYGKPVLASRRRCLMSVLVALSVRQSEISSIICPALFKLFRDTDFFTCDLHERPLSNVLTMLDLTAEAVCSRFYNCQESEFESGLQFLKIVVRHSCGKLSSICTQRVFKTLSFLCTYYSTRPHWLFGGYPNPCLENGAELPCFRVLKEFVWSIVAQVEAVDVAQSAPHSFKEETEQVHMMAALTIAQDPSSTGVDPTLREESALGCSQLVFSITEDIIDTIEVCRMIDTVRNLAQVQSSSTTSGKFWDESNKLSRKLYDDMAYRTAAVALMALCKVACQKIRVSSKGGTTPRDLGSKLLALESIADFCFTAGEKMKASKVVGIQIRRLVVPVLLSNIPTAVNEPKVFSKLIKLVSALWKSWRQHIRVEFALIVERLVMPVLEASSLTIRTVLQMSIMQELLSWMEQPYILLEMFVNYDMERSLIAHRPVFSNLVLCACTIARRCSLITGAWDWKPPEAQAPMTVLEALAKPSVAVRDINAFALEVVARIIKTIMDAAGHAHLLLVDEEFRTRALQCAPLDIGKYMGQSPGSASELSPSGSPTSRRPSKRAGIPRNRSNSTSSSQSNQSVIDTEDLKGWSTNFPAKYRHAMHEEAHEAVIQAFEIFNRKKSIFKMIDHLVSKNCLERNPQEIACFLRAYQVDLDLTSIGDYLGEGGVSPEEITFWNQVRYRYLRPLSFLNMEIEPALRLYLTGGGYRLPGEAQKIDRFVEAFQKLYWADNEGEKCCPLRSPDTVHILTFAIIMLNTDLHRAQDTKGKKRKRMTQAEFINNLRGADKGENIDRRLLCRIYDSIAVRPIELNFDDSENNTTADGATPDISAPSPKLPSDPATPNMGCSNDSVDQALYVAPLQDISTNQEFVSAEERSLMKTIVKRMRDTETFLSTIACFSFPFRLTGIETKISIDVVAYLFESVAHGFLPIVSELLGDQRYDMTITQVALDILCYGLTCAIFLDFVQKRREFAEILYNFQQKCIVQSRSDDEVLMDHSWFEDVCADQLIREDILDHIAILHRLVVVLKDVIQQVAHAEITRTMAEKIEKKAHVLESNSFFIREGLLGKKHPKTGKIDPFRVFLFSDELFFCSHVSAANGEFKLFDQLSLELLSVADVADDPNSCSFYLSHVKQSFIVVTDNPQVKYEWMRDTQEAIRACQKRIEEEKEKRSQPEKTSKQRPSLVRKMSIMNRIEEQQSTLNNEYSRKVMASPKGAPSAANNKSFAVDTEADSTQSRRRSQTMTPYNDHGNAVQHSLLASVSTDSNTSERSHHSKVGNLEPIPEVCVGPNEPATPSSMDSPGASRQRQVPALTPQEREARNQEAISNLSDKLQDISEKSLAQLFNAVCFDR